MVSRKPRLALFVLITALCLAVGFKSVGLNLSNLALDRGQFALAARLSGAARSQAAAGAASLMNKDTAAARRFALKAIESSPLDVRGLRLLGEVEEAEGHPAAQERMMLLAARAGWRDRQTQLWALERALRRHVFATAVQRGEALLRVNFNPETLQTAFRMLAQFEAGRRALVPSLAASPFWRLPFFQASGDIPPRGRYRRWRSFCSI